MNLGRCWKAVRLWGLQKHNLGPSTELVEFVCDTDQMIYKSLHGDTLMVDKRDPFRLVTEDETPTAVEPCQLLEEGSAELIFFTANKLPNGKKRELPTVLVIFDANVVKIVVHERQQGLQAWFGGASLSLALRAMVEGLLDQATVWKRPTPRK